MQKTKIGLKKHFSLKQNRLKMKEIFKNSVPSISLCNDNKNVTRGPESKSGRIILLKKAGGRQRKIPVFIRVYKRSFEHYAVLYRDQKFSLQTGYINLKNCTVIKADDKIPQFEVTMNDSEGVGLSFEAESNSEASDWVAALEPQIVPSSPTSCSISPVLSPKIPREPLMPTLEETGEDP